MSSLRSYTGISNQRKVLAPIPDATTAQAHAGEKRVNFATPPRYNKSQKTSNAKSPGYTQIFNQSTKDTDTSPPLQPVRQQIPNELQKKQPHPLPKPTNIRDNASPSRGPPSASIVPSPGNSHNTLTPRSPAVPDQNAILQVISLLRNEVSRLQGEITKINKEQQAELSSQQQLVEFLRSQVVSGDEERKKQRETFDEQMKQLTQQQKELYAQIREKEKEIRDLLSRQQSKQPSSDDEDDDCNLVSSQESLQALCRTQQVRKPLKPSVISTNENDVAKQRLQIISEILQRPGEDILKGIVFGDQPIAAMSSPIDDSEIIELRKQLAELEKQLQSSKRDSTFLQEQISRKELENKRLVNECRSLVAQIGELQEALDTIKKREKQTEKVYNHKFGTMRNLAIELREHIQAQQLEISALKEERKKAAKIIAELEKNEKVYRVDQKKPQRTNDFGNTKSRDKNERTAPNSPLIDNVNQQKKSNSPMNNSPQEPRNREVCVLEDSDIEDGDDSAVLVPCSGEIVSSMDDNLPEESLPTSPVRSFDDYQESQCPQSSDSQFAQTEMDVNMQDMGDCEDEVGNEDEDGTTVQPILSVEQYAAQAYAAENHKPRSPVKQKSPQAKSPKSVDDLDMSLSQEMDSILGMSQYKTPNFSAINNAYDFTASPLQDLNADPSIRAQTTATALSKLESVSSQ